MNVERKVNLLLAAIMVLILVVIALFFVWVEVARAHHEVGPFEVNGTASHYACTRGWCDGTATVALPQALGGRYDGTVHGWVEVCADRCATIAVVDYCQCYWGTADQRVVDLNEAAWRLVTSQPLSAGLVGVSVRSVEEPGEPGSVGGDVPGSSSPGERSPRATGGASSCDVGQRCSSTQALPNTALPRGWSAP